MAATALLRINVDDKGNIALNQLRNNLDKAQKKSEGFASSIKKIVSSLVLFRTINKVTESITNMSNEILEFNKTFKQTQGITRMSGDEIDRLKDLTIGLSNETEHSAVTIGKAALQLSKMGIKDVAKQMDILPKAADLATAGVTDMTGAIQIAGDITRAFFGEDLSQFGRVVNVLQGVMSSTSVGFDDIAQSMRFVAPISVATGMKIEELGSLIGVLGDTGVRATASGTALKNAFLNLLKPAEAVKKELETMNLKNMNFVEILAELNKRGLNTIDFLDTFNLRAIAPVLSLSKLTKKVNTLTEALERQDVKVDEASKKIRDSWKDQLDRLKNNFSNVFIELSRAMEDVSSGGIFDSIIKFFGDLQQKIKDNSKAIKDWTQKFVNQVVKVFEWVIDNREKILNFFKFLLKVKILRTVNDLGVGLTKVVSEVKNFNKTKPTGCEKWVAGFNAVALAAQAAYIAASFIGGLAEDHGNKLEALGAAGGMVDEKSLQKKLDALYEYEHILERLIKAKENKNVFESAMEGLNAEGDVRKLVHKYKLPLEFFTMNKNLDILHKSQYDLIAVIEKLNWEEAKRAAAEKALTEALKDDDDDDEKEKEKDGKSTYGSSLSVIQDPPEDLYEAKVLKIGDILYDSFSEGLNNVMNKFIDRIDRIDRLEPYDIRLKKIPEFRMSNVEIGDTTTPEGPFAGVFEDSELKKYLEREEKFRSFMEERNKAIKDMNDKNRKDMDETRKKSIETAMSIANSYVSVATSVVNLIQTLSQASAAKAEEQYETEMRRLKEKFDMSIKLAEGDATKKRQLQEEYERKQEELKNKTERIRQQEADKNKEYALFNAIIQGAVAFVGAMAQTQGNAALRIAAGLAVAAETALQIGVIMAENYRDGSLTNGLVGSKNNSRYIRGGGNGSSDSVIGFLSRGEYVVDSETTRRMGGESGMNQLLDNVSDKYEGVTVILNNPQGDVQSARRNYKSVFGDRRRWYV